MSSIKGLNKRTLLVILDGYGVNPDSPKNAIIDAETPTLDALFDNFPYTTIETSGNLVGLPEGVIGNSEVGHMNIGAGRPILQDLLKIDRAVEKGELEGRPKMQELITKAKKKSGRVHLMGLLSDGGVHSNINHIKEIIKILSKNGLEVFYHAFMDGRDTARDSGINYVKELNKEPNFTFASMQGRSIAMDRDHRYEKTERAYKAMIGKGEINENISPEEYILSQYSQELYDEFVHPVLFSADAAIKNDDSVFFINFRPDRAAQLTRAFTMDSFSEFPVDVRPHYYLCMTPYINNEIELPILFDKEALSHGLSETLSERNYKQFKIAETEKFAHVTFFFNGGRKETYPNEERVLIPSPKEVATYDEKPEMSALLVLDKLLEALDDTSISAYTVNFANCDMVGHTGNYHAALEAVKTVDHCVAKLMEKCKEHDIPMMITADHGNSDQMTYDNGEPHTSHTGSVVPFCIYHEKLKGEKLKPSGKDLALKDIAPTILYVMGEEIPKEFEGAPIFN